MARVLAYEGRALIGEGAGRGAKTAPVRVLNGRLGENLRNFRARLISICRELAAPDQKKLT